MTRMLGPLRTSGRLNVTAEKGIDGLEYYIVWCPSVIVIGITLSLLGFGSTLPTILEA